MRRVSLDIDGVKHDVTVDVRDSLWETMTRSLNKASSNLCCDRAQCGACMVVVDGRAVNGCTVLSARLGRGQIELRAPSPVLASADALAERLRAAEMLYEIGERDVVLYFAADLGEQSSDVTLLEALGELTGRRDDARTMLQIGKRSLGRGLPLDHYAFPTIGIPSHRQVAP